MSHPDQVVCWPDGTQATLGEVQAGEFNHMSDDYKVLPEEIYADPDCTGCGGGDKVPADEDYWRCPKCDAEWFEEGVVVDPNP